MQLGVVCSEARVCCSEGGVRWMVLRREGQLRVQNASRDYNAAGGAMREPNRDGVLEAAVLGARHQQGRHS